MTEIRSSAETIARFNGWPLAGKPAEYDNKTEAINSLDRASILPSDSPGTAVLLAEAQVHATLYAAEQTAALVEQKRIANLISLIGFQASLGARVAVSDVYLYRDIKEGLGL